MASFFPLLLWKVSLGSSSIVCFFDADVDVAISVVVVVVDGGATYDAKNGLTGEADKKFLHRKPFVAPFLPLASDATFASPTQLLRHRGVSGFRVRRRIVVRLFDRSAKKTFLLKGRHSEIEHNREATGGSLACTSEQQVLRDEGSNPGHKQLFFNPNYETFCFWFFHFFHSIAGSRSHKKISLIFYSMLKSANQSGKKWSRDSFDWSNST